MVKVDIRKKRGKCKTFSFLWWQSLDSNRPWGKNAESGTGTLGHRQLREGEWRFRPRREPFGPAQSLPSTSVRRPLWAARHALCAARRSGPDTAIPAAGRSFRFPDCDSSLPRAIGVCGAEILVLGGTILHYFREPGNFCKESCSMHW